MKFPSHVPDGTRCHDARGLRVVVFNPPWWRLDRWLAWAWMTTTGARHGTARFSALVPPADGRPGRIEEFDLRVYEEPEE